MRKWEYRQLQGTTPDFETDLNDMGGEGWDLIFVTTIPSTSPLQLLAILKRERTFATHAPAHEEGRSV
jgi:hypothetical protein